MSQIDNMEAVNRYMRTQPIVNNNAFPIKDSFIRWWDNLSWYSKHVDGDAWDEARTRRNKFNLANVRSEEERANVVRVITTGIESEEMEGKERVKTLSTGEVGSQITKPKTSTSVGKTNMAVPSTIKKGSSGPDVVKWQQILGVTADGKFGPGTEAATKAWQSAQGLTADGIVGPATWSAALKSSTPEPFRKPEDPITPSKPVLSLNSKGPDVIQWQGIVGVRPATGFFGQMTVDYTKRWQTQNGLPATGIVDAKSWEKALGGGAPFAPAVKPEPSFAPTPTPKFAPSSGTKPVSPGTKPKVAEKEKKSRPKIATAGMFDFTKWPGWAQAAAVGTALTGIGYAIFGKGGKLG